MNIPITVTSPSDFIAGCLARTRAPIPMNIMMAEWKMLFL